MRLIDADVFKEYIRESFEEAKGEFQTEKYLKIADSVTEGFLKDIDEQPTVEAKSVEWISCSERLPNCNGCYLVWRPHFFSGKIGMSAICYFDGQDTWHDSYGVDFTRILNEKDVIAWMPLPAPYNVDMRGGKNEEY